MPHYKLELSFAPQRVCGVDEAGRGPLAGPVVAASVLFAHHKAIPKGLDDSKKLTATTRQELAAALRSSPDHIFIGVGIATVEEIAEHNIWGATCLAMRRAAEAMAQPVDLALVDGNLTPRGFPYTVKPVIGGDGISLSIAAASIIAKTTRDAIMHDYALTYPDYGFERHVGYGTAIHRAALVKHGPCPIHRRGFKLVSAPQTEEIYESA